MLHKEGSLIRLPLPVPITSMGQKQQQTFLYELKGTEWKLVQDK